MASSFLKGGLDGRSWRRSDPPNADAAFSFLRQPSLPTNHSPHSSTSSYVNGNGNTNANGNTNGDARGHAHRRFTSSFASPFGYSRAVFEEPPVPDIPAAFKQAMSPGDKKKAEYEFLMQKKLDRQRQFERLSRDREQDELDMLRLQQELGFASTNNAGPQSEPTTPPEYGENAFPTSLSRPNRFSTSNLISGSSGIFGSRKPQADSNNVASPPNERARAYNALTGGSGPHSKHNSDEEDAYDDMLDFNHRSAALVNRNSMPVTRRDHTNRNGLTDSPSLLGHVNTHAFLFGDEDNVDNRPSNGDMSEGKRPVSYISSTEAGFPVLLRQQTSERTESSDSSAQASKRSSLRRSLPPQAFGTQKGDDSPPLNYSSTSSRGGLSGSGQATPTKSSSSNRHSFGAPFTAGTFSASTNAKKRPGLIGSPPDGASEPASTPKLQSSYSTNDIPTVKSTSSSSTVTASTATAEQRLHQHNASLGRIPASAMSSNRQSREIATSNAENAPHVDENNIYSILQSPLKGTSTSTGSSQGSLAQNSSVANQVPPFQQAAPPGTQTQDTNNVSATTYNPVMFSSYGQPAIPTYGMQSTIQSPIANPMTMLNASMGAMTVGGASGQTGWAQQNSMFGNQQYQAPPTYNATAFPSYTGGGRFQDASPRNPPSQRRNHGNSDADSSRFANIPLESLQGEVYALCKDQHGCRFLQKKLEDRNPKHVELIYNETKGHMVELMTDPFGNYLCQKLLEHTNDDQRTGLINSAAPHMVKIALNQHGTRALQKMIEYVITRGQIDTLIQALQDHVVEMIQDLNGNHVIQKCLNRLHAEDVQFIISAVSINCVVVGTHRHGCCVIQRCIDHATGAQKAQLVGAITNCSFPLVQDPFGNYVLQYIFDQNEDQFSHLLCRTFLGHISNLSKQKFSSNVIEKCIRIADAETRHAMIEEIIISHDFDRLVDDPFANYVVQTAWIHADAEDEIRIAERMRPILPRLRHKPHGRRFQLRLQETEKRHPGMLSAVSYDVSSPEPKSAMTAQHQPQQPQESFYQPPDSGYGNGFSNFGGTLGSGNTLQTKDYSRPSTHRSSNPPPHLPSAHSMPAMSLGGYQGQQFGSYNSFGVMGQGNGNPWGTGMFGQHHPQY